MSARSQDDADDLIPVGNLSGAELLYLKPSEKRQERISRRLLQGRVASVQGETLKAMRETGQVLNIRQQLDDARGMTTTAVSESVRVTAEGLQPVRTP